MNDASHKPLAVVLGASTGGLHALQTILKALPVNFPGVILIVQHRKFVAEDLFLSLLRSICQLPAAEVIDKMAINPGHIYLAPPDYHLMIEQDRSLSLSIDPPVSYARPSIDVLFETAAETYREQLVGVLLTGANHDGTAGMRKIMQYGGVTIAQDPGTAESSIMPQSAIDAGVVDHVLPLSEIGPFLVGLFNQDLIRDNN
jgi:two-component system chemotaxis response regulator CheB